MRQEDHFYSGFPCCCVLDMGQDARWLIWGIVELGFPVLLGIGFSHRTRQKRSKILSEQRAKGVVGKWCGLLCRVPLVLLCPVVGSTAGREGSVVVNCLARKGKRVLLSIERVLVRGSP